MGEKKENLYSISAPREFFSAEGQQDAVAWGRGDHLAGAQAVPASMGKSLALVAVVMNDTPTVVAANPNFQKVTNGMAFFRPDFESHIFFETHWIIEVQTGGVAPTTPLDIEIQTWLNQYHILISPSGFANDWTLSLPAIGASQRWEFTQTYVGGIFNLELRKSPEYHLIEFMYRAVTVPTGWSLVEIRPRMTLVYAIPSPNISFVKV